MLLAIDVGNTRIKYAVFKQDTILKSFVSENQYIEKKIKDIFNSFPNISDLIISSVGKYNEDDFLWIDKSIKIKFITNKSDFPFQNKYKTPETLGIDRMILASGAAIKFPKKNKLVIDAGTAITYDFIDSDNNYYGGAISAGINLRYKALNNYTAKLPLLNISENNYLIGQNTTESIHSGVINGVIYEIEGFINHLQQNNENFIVILTGGDAEFLAKRLKSTIFANSNFLLESLNDLFQYQNND